jgi:amidase
LWLPSTRESYVIEQRALTVSDLIVGYHSKTFSPTEICATLLERAHATQQTIAPFVEIFDDDVIAQAEESVRRFARGEARPLEGVPMPIKDNVAIAGHTMSAGSSAMRPHIADADAPVVARLRGAGAILFGRTTCPEFCTLPVTEWVDREPTRNPFDLSRVPGGSSGGSAAAVASGVAPAAHGNDGAGSLRIPASCCGLVGVKPTRGRVPMGPTTGPGPSGMICEGFLTRVVADQARLLDVTAGPILGEPSILAGGARSLLEMPRIRRPLNIGVTVAPPLPVAVDPACADAVQKTAAILEEAGHLVREIDSPWGDERMASLFGLAWAAVITQVSDTLVAQGLDIAAIEPHNTALRISAAQTPLPQYLAALDDLARYCRRVLSLWDALDVLITPTLATPPIEVGKIFEHVHTNPMSPVEAALGFVPFTPVPNLTGQPAASVPMHLDPATGLPIGVQLIAGFGREDVLLSVAYELEPYFRRPDLAVQVLASRHNRGAVVR